MFYNSTETNFTTIKFINFLILYRRELPNETSPKRKKAHKTSLSGREVFFPHEDSLTQQTETAPQPYRTHILGSEPVNMKVLHYLPPPPRCWSLPTTTMLSAAAATDVDGDCYGCMRRQHKPCVKDCTWCGGKTGETYPVQNTQLMVTTKVVCSYM